MRAPAPSFSVAGTAQPQDGKSWGITFDFRSCLPMRRPLRRRPSDGDDTVRRHHQRFVNLARTQQQCSHTSSGAIATFVAVSQHIYIYISIYLFITIAHTGGLEATLLICPLGVPLFRRPMCADMWNADDVILTIKG